MMQLVHGTIHCYSIGDLARATVGSHDTWTWKRSRLGNKRGLRRWPRANLGRNVVVVLTAVVAKPIVVVS